MEVGQQGRRVLGVGNEIRGQDVRVVAAPGGLALLLHLHLVDVGDFALDRLDGLGLVDRLDVEGDGHFRVQLQQLQQELVGQLGGHDLQVGGRPPGLAHPEGAGLPEVEAGGNNEIFRPHARLGDVPPGEAEGLPAPWVHLSVERLQSLPPIQGHGMYPQPLEVAHDVRLHPLQPGPGGGEVGGGNTKGDVLGAHDPVVAPGNLPFEHFRVLGPDAVKGILGRGNVHLIAAPATGAVVDEGELEGQGAVKVVQEGAPAAKDSRLILGACHRIIDVLIGDGLGIVAVPHLANAVFEHFHIGDGLLGGQGRPPFTPCGAVFCCGVAFGQSAPPFL